MSKFLNSMCRELVAPLINYFEKESENNEPLLPLNSVKEFILEDSLRYPRAIQIRGTIVNPDYKWYEGDLLKSIACGLFDYCDDEDYEEDCQDTEATTTVTPNTTDPFFMKPLILESPTPPMTTPAIQNETR
ncbi:uncharacterized protein [Euwallacea similis]|uniref:uncharacterized protein isoform X2 n=1 Tax=Euwallacea similis TaxID=1736056 RepID=UPI00345098D1